MLTALHRTSATARRYRSHQQEGIRISPPERFAFKPITFSSNPPGSYHDRLVIAQTNSGPAPRRIRRVAGCAALCFHTSPRMLARHNRGSEGVLRHARGSLSRGRVTRVRRRTALLLLLESAQSPHPRTQFKPYEDFLQGA